MNLRHSCIIPPFPFHFNVTYALVNLTRSEIHVPSNAGSRVGVHYQPMATPALKKAQFRVAAEHFVRLGWAVTVFAVFAGWNIGWWVEVASPYILPLFSLFPLSLSLFILFPDSPEGFFSDSFHTWNKFNFKRVQKPLTKLQARNSPEVRRPCTKQVPSKAGQNLGKSSLKKVKSKTWSKKWSMREVPCKAGMCLSHALPLVAWCLMHMKMGWANKSHIASLGKLATDASHG